MPNCQQATCKGDDIISLDSRQCPELKPLTCANGYPALKVADADGCCQHYECQCERGHWFQQHSGWAAHGVGSVLGLNTCFTGTVLPAGVCSGWGDPHYITFDGTYYTFLDDCTYVLVQQIVPVFGHFRVLVDNVFCDTEDGVSCPQSIIVEYHEDRVVLIRRLFGGAMTNQVGLWGQRFGLWWGCRGLCSPHGHAPGRSSSMVRWSPLASRRMASPCPAWASRCM